MTSRTASSSFPPSLFIDCRKAAGVVVVVVVVVVSPSSSSCSGVALESL